MQYEVWSAAMGPALFHAIDGNGLTWGKVFEITRDAIEGNGQRYLSFHYRREVKESDKPDLDLD